ncbi:MAG: fluoride efflux transporter CrcB [Formosimonas sp.]
MPFLYIAIGGALGSVLRFVLASWGGQMLAWGKFPIGTFLVNLLGCLLAGILAGLADKYAFFSHELRLFVFTGFLGGLTTFSAFGLETVQLLRRGDWTVAVCYVLGSVLLGIALLALGFFVSQKIG